MDKNFFSEKKLSIFASIISIISIIVSIGFSVRSCSLENKLNKLHIDPVIDCYLVRSSDKKALEFYIKNKSPIDVVNLSVSYKSLYFDVKLDKYVTERPAASSIFDEPGQNWIFKPKVSPNESIGKKEHQILSQFRFYNGKYDMISTLIFEIVYYRYFDMKQFNTKAIFFFDGERIYSYKNALEQEKFIKLIDKLPEFESQMLKFRNEMGTRSDGSRIYQKAQ